MKIAALVKETTNTTGTGTYTLNGVTAGFRSFASAVGNGEQCPYICRIDGGAWEIGIGTVNTGASTTIVRTQIISSSNGGAPVNWGAGAKDIYLALHEGTGLLLSRLEEPLVTNEQVIEGLPSSSGTKAQLSMHEASMLLKLNNAPSDPPSGEFRFAGGSIFLRSGTSNIKPLLSLDQYGEMVALDGYNLLEVATNYNVSRNMRFRVNRIGHVYADGPYTGTGAGFAELFPWHDGNPDGEDRTGWSVVMDKKGVRIAGGADPKEEIIGVITAEPSVVGNFGEQDSIDGPGVACVSLLGQEYVREDSLVHPRWRPLFWRENYWLVR